MCPITSVQLRSTQHLVSATPNLAIMLVLFCLLLGSSSSKQWKKLHLRVEKHSNLPFAEHFKHVDDAADAFPAVSSYSRIINRDNKPWKAIQPQESEKKLQEDVNQWFQFDDSLEDIHKCYSDKKQGSSDSFSLDFNFDGLEVKILRKKNNESEPSTEVVLNSADSNELITDVLRIAYTEGLEEKVAETYYKLCAASKENSEILLTSEFEYLLRIEYNRLGVSIEDFKSWREGGGAYDDNHIHESWKVSSYACVYMHMYI